MMQRPRIEITDQEVAQYQRDGAGVCRHVLDGDMIAEAEKAFQWSIDHPSPAAQRYYGSAENLFYQDLFNTLSWKEYSRLFTESALPDALSRLWQCQDIWFFFEQVFYKKGGNTRRTPWHQDTSYFPIEGRHLAVVWICLEPVSKSNSLEFVRGSHRGPVYNGSSFADNDDTAPLYPEDAMPRLPDIEKQRDRWDIISWAVAPGDVVVFHPSTLHGGAPTVSGFQRRTLSLRYFGADAIFVERPCVNKESSVGFNRESGDSRNIADFYVGLKAGDAFRNPAFPKVRPRAAPA